MTKYGTALIGILILACIPDTAGWLQLVLQAVVGLSVFVLGTILILEEAGQ